MQPKQSQPRNRYVQTEGFELENPIFRKWLNGCKQKTKNNGFPNHSYVNDHAIISSLQLMPYEKKNNDCDLAMLLHR